MKHQSRTFDLKVLVFLLLLVSVNGWLRLQQAVFYWNTLNQVEIAVPPLYLAISGAVFGIAMLSAAIWLWSGLAHYRLFVSTVVVAFSLWYWIDRITLTQNSAAQTNWPFALLVTAFLWIFTFSVLAVHPPLWDENPTRFTQPASAGEESPDDAGN